MDSSAQAYRVPHVVPGCFLSTGGDTSGRSGVRVSALRSVRSDHSIRDALVSLETFLRKDLRSPVFARTQDTETDLPAPSHYA